MTYDEWVAEERRSQAELNRINAKWYEARIKKDREAAARLEDEWYALMQQSRDHMKKMPPKD